MRVDEGRNCRTLPAIDAKARTAAVVGGGRGGEPAYSGPDSELRLKEEAGGKKKKVPR